MKGATALRKQVTIRRAVETADSQGGLTETWQDLATVFASVRPVSSEEVEFAGSSRAGVSHEVLIRHRPDVEADQQIVMGSRTLYIAGVVNVDERDEWLLLECEERAT